MSKTAKNLIYNIAYQIVILLLPFVTAPYLSRIVGPTGIGTFSYYSSISEYFICFAMLGILNYGNRQIAKNSQNKDYVNNTFTNIYTLQIVTSFIVTIVYALFIRFIADNKIIACIFIIQVFASIFDINWLFWGLQKFKITSIVQILVRLITFSLIFVFVKTESDLRVYCLIMCCGTFASYITLRTISWKQVKFIKPSIIEIKKALKPCLLLFIPIIATSIYRQMDKIMIGGMLDLTQLGYYENAEKLVRISLGIISAFSAVLLPKVSNLLAHGEINKAKKIIYLSMKFAMCIGIAITFGLIAIAKEFIPLYFGSEFRESVNLLIVLSISVPFISRACIVRTLFLIPAEHDKIYIQSVVIGAILNFGLNFLFINLLGTLGAVLATVFSEAFVAIYQTIRVWKELNFKLYLKDTLFFLISGIIMLFVVRMVAIVAPYGVVGIICEITTGAFVYLLLTLNYLNFSNTINIKQIINKIKNRKG